MADYIVILAEKEERKEENILVCLVTRPERLSGYCRKIYRIFLKSELKGIEINYI